ncbi:MAG: hypothetical protein WC846_03865 [Candidatus Gracilibacteria bacterium]|jgi:hypothetical protein
MFTPKKKSLPKILFVLLFLLVAILVAASPFVYKKMISYANTTITDEEDNACAKAMQDEGYKIVEAYEEMLDEYFKIDVPSSQQINSAMVFYRATRDSLNGLYIDSLNLGGRKSLEFAVAEAATCTDIKNKYMTYVGALLQRYLLGSAVSKSTYTIVDGLKAMNKDIEDLSTVFHNVFPAVFDQMNNALPCYARQCIVK